MSTSEWQKMAAHSTYAVMGAILLVYCAALTTATVYTVGESSGWNTGVDFSSWTSGKIFVVGDSLTFNYAPGTHTVNEVKAKDYKACSASTYLSTDSSGSTTIPLKKAGSHYFFCSIPGHCSSGMKLAVTVVSSSSSSPSPSPSSAPTPSSPPSAASPISSPAPASSSSSNISKPTTTNDGHRYAHPLVTASLLSLLIVGIF